MGHSGGLRSGTRVRSLLLSAKNSTILISGAVCLLPRFQEAWYDQFEHIPQNIQVQKLHFNRQYQSNICRRVGDIVDIKANGAVQKGFANIAYTLDGLC